MSTSQPTSDKDSDEKKSPPTQSTVILLLGTMADTTWRMFVPTIGFILLGYWADTSWGTKPWMTILGILVGTAVTALLIRQQLRSVKQDDQ